MRVLRKRKGSAYEHIRSILLTTCIERKKFIFECPQDMSIIEKLKQFWCLGAEVKVQSGKFVIHLNDKLPL